MRAPPRGVRPEGPGWARWSWGGEPGGARRTEPRAACAPRSRHLKLLHVRPRPGALPACRVLVIDLHSGQSMGYFDIPVDHVYGESVILDYLASKRIATGELVVVSPDVGGVARCGVAQRSRLCGRWVLADSAPDVGGVARCGAAQRSRLCGWWVLAAGAPDVGGVARCAPPPGAGLACKTAVATVALRIPLVALTQLLPRSHSTRRYSRVCVRARAQGAGVCQEAQRRAAGHRGQAPQRAQRQRGERALPLSAPQGHSLLSPCGPSLPNRHGGVDHSLGARCVVATAPRPAPGR